uniref:RabBD domain-containing protein n=1 Tax=Gongylonema pulchrum TaxID=637853 RepID=A0A183DG37_9BILA
LESLVQERVAKARADLESRLRSQIEQEMMHEVEESRKREVCFFQILFPKKLLICE